MEKRLGALPAFVIGLVHLPPGPARWDWGPRFGEAPPPGRGGGKVESEPPARIVLGGVFPAVGDRVPPGRGDAAELAVPRHGHVPQPQTEQEGNEDVAGLLPVVHGQIDRAATPQSLRDTFGCGAGPSRRTGCGRTGLRVAGHSASPPVTDLMKRTRLVWPRCSEHELGLHAMTREGAAVWWCAGGGGHVSVDLVCFRGPRGDGSALPGALAASPLQSAGLGPSCREGRELRHSAASRTTSAVRARCRQRPTPVGRSEGAPSMGRG
jgi:hypothetical protein